MIFYFLACTTPFEGLEEAKTQSLLENMVSFTETTFDMGYPDTEPGPYGNHWKETQQPMHRVNLSAYSIDKTEVSVAQYIDFLNTLQQQGGSAASAHYHPLQPILWDGDTFIPVTENELLRPIRYVSWYDAVTYCSWLGKQLPTEAQWEQAAKGDDLENPRRFPWEEGGANCQKAVYFTNKTLCEDYPAEVGSHPDGNTPQGVSDLAGNVSEWVWDWFDRYSEEEQTDPNGPDSGKYKILRGGGFRETSDALRTADRVVADPLSRSEGIGFRCVVPQ